MTLPVIYRLTASARHIMPRWLRRLIVGSQTGAWIRRRLNARAPSGLTLVTVEAGPLAGQRMEIDFQREKAYWLGDYEPDLMAEIGRRVQPGMTVFDVGANIGYVTLMLARAVGPKGRVIAVEPLPMNVERIRRHLELNAVADRVEVVGVAVSDRSGTERFLVHDEHAMGKLAKISRRADGWRSTIDVRSEVIDKLVFQDGLPRPDLLKIDIEGAGVVALPGMKQLLCEARPVVLMEIHDDDERDVAWSTLSQAGYILRRLGEASVIGSRSDMQGKTMVVAMPREERS